MIFSYLCEFFFKISGCKVIVITHAMLGMHVKECNGKVKALEKWFSPNLSSSYCGKNSTILCNVRLKLGLIKQSHAKL